MFPVEAEILYRAYVIRQAANVRGSPPAMSGLASADSPIIFASPPRRNRATAPANCGTDEITAELLLRS
jgi:hypothetical protein